MFDGDRIRSILGQVPSLRDSAGSAFSFPALTRSTSPRPSFERGPVATNWELGRDPSTTFDLS